MEHIFRIFDFNVYNSKDTSLSESSDEEQNVYKDTNNFVIQIFGVDEIGKTYSLIAEGYKPFFYVMVNDKWTIQMKEGFLAHLKDKFAMLPDQPDQTMEAYHIGNDKEVITKEEEINEAFVRQMKYKAGIIK